MEYTSKQQVKTIQSGETQILYLEEETNLNSTSISKGLFIGSFEASAEDLFSLFMFTGCST